MSVERALIHQLDEPSPVTLLIFVDYGESLETAAIREAKEETNLSISILGPLGAYSDPNRDAHLHTISYVFKTTGQGRLMGLDDAKEAAVFTKETLPPLVFDHGQIIRDYFLCKK